VTERLYYSDPYLTEFDAQVLAVKAVGDRTAVVLDRTAFYPTSGGQPFDLGSIGSADVVDVIDQDDGTILHIVAGPPPAGQVQGRVQWARRFEHMQQHTGQHVLSAAFDRLQGVTTVSFHLGSTAATIDLAREVTAGEIAQAEDLANQVIWDDRPVHIRFVDAERAAALPLRKETARTGHLRIIEVEEFDVSACGGTHVSRTGAIGIIVVSAFERFKGGTRLEFRCGIRALRAHRGLRDSVAGAVRLLSTSADDLGLAIERLQAENKDAKRALKDVEARLAIHEAAALAARAVEAGGRRTVIEALDGWDVNGLKTIAQGVAARPGHVAVLLTTSTPRSIVVARAADVSVDAAAMLKKLIGQFGGKGGGRPELAQGGGLGGSVEQLRAAIGEQLG
jgi:alanyl-tRNA synthetase